jgi:hypothetical protein
MMRSLYSDVPIPPNIIHTIVHEPLENNPARDTRVLLARLVLWRMYGSPQYTLPCPGSPDKLQVRPISCLIAAVLQRETGSQGDLYRVSSCSQYYFRLIFS